MHSSNARFDCGGALAVPATEISIKIALGDVEPMTCSVEQPHGVTAGELLAEAQARLVALLTHQLDALPDFARTDENLVSEITQCLASIQRFAATDPTITLA